MSKPIYLHNLKLTVYTFLLFVVINTLWFICTKYLDIGWTEQTAWHESLYVPLAYSIVFFATLIFTNKAIIILPSLYLFGAIVVILLDDFYGIELVASINVLFSSVINVGDFLLQKNNLKTPVLEYGLHTVGMFLYQFGILKIGLLLTGVEDNE